MRLHLLTIGVLLLECASAQKVSIKTSDGNEFVGKKTTQNEENQTCIQTQSRLICFHDSVIVSISPYKAANYRLPLTKFADPLIVTEDIGIIARGSVIGPGLYTSLALQKRINDEWSLGVRGHLGIGDFLEIGAQGICSYQFNTETPRVQVLSFMAGTMKELVYWSTAGFDGMLEWSLLFRRERFHSRRFNVGIGLTSANFLWCKNNPGDPLPCIETISRNNMPHIRISYGWQF